MITIERPREHARFWIEIDSPDGKQPAKPPGFLRDILGQVAAVDGAAPLTDLPLVYTRDDIGLLEDQINDEARHGVLFVAGTSPDLPLDEWRQLVRTITYDTCGMATTIVLAADATDAFNGSHEPLGYQVPPGTIRSFQPGAHLEDESDARRNKILGTGRLVADSDKYLRRVLASVARRAVVGLPLTKSERDANRALDKVEADELLGLAAKQPTTVLTPPEGTPAVIVDALPEPKHGRRNGDSDPALDTTAESLGNNFLNRLVRVVTNTFETNWGRGTFQPSDLPLVEQALLNDPEAARRDREQLRQKLNETQQALADARTRLQEARNDLVELDLDLAIEREGSLSKNSEIRILHKKLALARPTDDVYAESTEDPRVHPPTSFAALQETVRFFTHLDFTCDWGQAAALDDTCHAPTSRLQSLWEGFLALDDYAAAKLAGDFRGSFFEYNAKSPSGYATIPKTRFAADESETVKDGKKSMRERSFPVPTGVSSSGEAPMTSHLKPGNRTTDPRAYFLDVTGTRGTIVVGYIGRHLDVKSTN